MSGRERKRLGNAVGLTPVRRQPHHAQARRLVVAAPLARATRTSSSTCSKARSCCARTTARPCSSPATPPASRPIRGNGHCLINRRQPRRASISRSARGLSNETVVYPDIDMRARARQDRQALSAQVRRAVFAAEGVIACRRSTAPKSRSATTASYPKEFAHVIAGREKQKLGDAAGLDAVRRQHLAHQGAVAASALRHWHESEDEFIYVLEGELVLHEDDGETVLKPGDAAGWRANGGIGHCLINRTDTRRALSRSRHPRQGRARALSRRRFPHGARRQGPPLDAQVRRADQGIKRRCRE